MPRPPRSNPLCLKMASSLLVLVAAVALAGCKRKVQPASPPAKSEPAKKEPAKAAAPQPIQEGAIDLFAFGRQLGAIAPCGCTADPLGGLQYAFGYIDGHSDPSRRAILQGGSFLFPDPKGPNAAKEEAEWGQINERARLLTKAFSRFKPHFTLGLGPTDYSSPAGAKALETFAAARLSANLPPTAAPTLKAWSSISLGPGLSAAVTHVIDPSLQSEVPAMPKPSDPAAALGALLPKMKQAGHDLIIVTIQGQRDFAQALVRKVPGIDIAVVTGPIHSLENARLGGSPGLLGETWLVEPGDQAQTIAHLRLYLPAGLRKKAASQPEQDLIGPASQWALLASQSQKAQEAERIQKRLAKFEKDPSADPNFLARMRADLAKLQAPAPLPENQVAIRIEGAKVSCHGDANPKVQGELKAYDQWVAQSNKQRFRGVFAPKAKEGQASYVGDKTCRGCHAQAFEFWKKTHHAGAWATLERANKIYDLNCVSCHVTGYRQPGGSHLVENKDLRNVQCEQCHGPGSIHAKTANKSAISRQAPEALCKGCHTPEHSDTFQYTAYLRDVLGAGHGEAARKALGDGPTGHQLRSAALGKAGGQCK